MRRFISGYHFYGLNFAPGVAHDDLFYPAWGNIRFYSRDADWRIVIGEQTFDPVPHAALFGPTSRTSASRSTSGMLIGAGLTPLGWTRFVRAPAADFADRIVPLGGVVPGADGLTGAILAAPDATVAAAAMDAFPCAAGPPRAP